MTLGTGPLRTAQVAFWCYQWFGSLDNPNDVGDGEEVVIRESQNI
ncbi:hypothetical protein NECAME_06748 [Necator americanus]|uniref:Uncharacterized protein n=1 Tax=Necator americanus TaxID=51031 RepID=W2TSC7_NECAM|nr:hypothetical protein NECAME_06748 [Necator americanus]ETN84718.1 hypothetical protein NECAME_06748 [Necator americanus]